VNRLLALCAVAAVIGAAGCGVPIDRAPRPVDPPRGPFQELSAAESAPPAPGTVDGEIYLVRDDALVRVARRVPADVTADALVRDLVAGPTDEERDVGLTTALIGVTVDVRVDRGVAVVDLARLADTGRNDQVLTFGQLVCTLSTLPRVTGVSFIRDGRPIGVPRADGSLSSGPLTTPDYADLIRPA
jgi:Sporulation and spore germination